MVARPSRNPFPSGSSLEASASEHSSPATILVATDDADSRALLERAAVARWSLEIAADGEEALERIRKNPPDLLLADVSLPRLDGLALLNALRGSEETRGIPVILLADRVGAESRIGGLDGGPDDYLIKPFTPEELIVRVS